MTVVNIQGLSKAKILAALYNASAPIGMGFLQYDPTPMTEELAQKYLDQHPYMDYVHGRPMKLNFDSDEVLDVALYERDQGRIAEKIIDSLRDGGSITGPEIMKHSMETLQKNAAHTSNRLHEETRPIPGGIKLGLANAAEHLKPAIERALDQQS